MFLNKFVVTVSSSGLPAFEHHKLMNLQTLRWLPGERSLPIGLLVFRIIPKRNTIYFLDVPLNNSSIVSPISSKVVNLRITPGRNTIS